MTKYLAAQLNRGHVILEEKSLPQQPTSNTVIIKILASGICRADVKEVNNSRDIPKDRGPLFGHEINGTVHFAGGDTGVKEGSHVAFNPNVTRNRTTGFAEYMIVRDSKDKIQQAIATYDTTLNPQKAIFAEPFACIVHSLNQLNQNIGLNSLQSQSIAIIGAGNSGTLSGLLAKSQNARVKLFNIDDGRLEFAEQAFSPKELVRLAEYSKYQDSFDIVIICTTRSTDDVLAIAHQLVKPHGVIHIYGGTRRGETYLNSQTDIDTIRRQELVQQVNYDNKLVHLSGAYGFTAADFKKTFEIIEDFPLDELISRTISLEEFPQLIMAMAKGETDYPGKVIIQF